MMVSGWIAAQRRQCNGGIKMKMIWIQAWRRHLVESVPGIRHHPGLPKVMAAALLLPLALGLAPREARALSYRPVCGNLPASIRANSQLQDYCTAADKARKAVGDQKTLTALYAAASGICVTACAAQFTPMMQAAAPGLGYACSGANIVEGGVEAILARNLAQGLIGLFTGGVGLAAQMKLLGEYRYQNQIYENGFQLAHEDFERMLLGLPIGEGSGISPLDPLYAALEGQWRGRPVLLAQAAGASGPAEPVSGPPVSQTTNTVLTQTPGLANSVGTLAGGNANNFVQKAAPCFTAAVDIYETYAKAALTSKNTKILNQNLENAQRLQSVAWSRWTLVPAVIAGESVAQAVVPSTIPPGYFSRPECSSGVSALLDCARPVAPGLPVGISADRFQDLFLKISGTSLDEFMKQGDSPPEELLARATARAFTPGGRNGFGKLVASIEPEVPGAGILAGGSSAPPPADKGPPQASSVFTDGEGTAVTFRTYLPSGTGSPSRGPAGVERHASLGEGGRESLFERVSRAYRVKFPKF